MLRLVRYADRPQAQRIRFPFEGGQLLTG